MDRVIARPAPVATTPRRQIRWARSTLLYTLVPAGVAVAVLYPVLALRINSFQMGAYGTATTWGLDN